MLMTLGTGASFAQDATKSARQIHGAAIEALVDGSGDASLTTFAETHLAPDYRATFSGDGVVAFLRKIREACAGAGGILWEPTGDGATRIRFMQDARETPVVFRVQPDPPGLITMIQLEPSRPTQDMPAVNIAPITWDNLDARLTEEASAGFSGCVLVVHGGKVVLDRGYGLANREKNIPVTPETIFAIGSVPIDFTRAAILKLEEMGKLQTSDPITMYFSDVPDDKRAITIDQLMTGASGFPNFHHMPGADENPDLSWIDRAEAIRRILGKELLFAPGTGQAHSHSAWVLLAAIVEIVSKQSYGEFLQANFFGPAGMTRTGLHEDGDRFSDDEFAVGYDGESVGKSNTPKYWGRTSWLVMGSGGMFSTPRDLYAWLQAIRSGKTLSAKEAAKYWTHGVLAGGDDRGFFCLYTEGPDDLMIMCSNAHSRRGDRVSSVGGQLVRLVQP
jgi:CubicO group peptidase (beta-lactamase class C family)